MLFARFVRSSFALAAALALAACAKGPMSAAQPAGGPGDLPKDADGSLPGDPDAALAVLDRAEGDLTAALGAVPRTGAYDGATGGPAAPAKKKATAPGEPPPPPPAASPPAQAAAVPRAKPDSGPESRAERSAPVTMKEESQPTATGAEAEDDARQSTPPPPPCERACRALGSMQRATDHLCGLAGDADARCELARERVRSAGERVQSACPACQG